MATAASNFDPYALPGRPTTSTVLVMDERHQHPHRFRKVSNRWPRRVAGGYDGDRAVSDTDDDVAAEIVADWKKAQGLNVAYRQAIREVHPRP